MASQHHQKMNLIRSPIFWITLIGATIILVFIVTQNHNPSDWNFKDIVKNPEYWNNSQRNQIEVASAIEAALRWDDDKIASFTKQFVFKANSSLDSREDAQILRALGKRSHSTILTLLRNPSLYGQLVEPTGKEILPVAPFNRACDILGDTPEAEAVEVLAPFLGDPSEEIRKDAALTIAKTGAPTITPLIRQAFSDQDEYVRSYALMGLKFALNNSRLRDNVQTELFPDVLALLRANRNTDIAADLLYRFNSLKAKDYFLSQEVFTTESPILHETLKVLANAKVSVPLDSLKSLITSLDIHELKYPKTCALGEALRLLGQHQRGLPPKKRTRNELIFHVRFG